MIKRGREGRKESRIERGEGRKQKGREGRGEGRGREGQSQPHGRLCIFCPSVSLNPDWGVRYLVGEVHFCGDHL